jgi:hypothetical protein
LLSPSEALNPDFYSWNHIFVPYCSGDIWIGTELTTKNPFGGTEPYWFQGHSIIEQLLQEDTLPFPKAEQVLLTGCSAGGIGSFHHADWLTEILPHAVVKTNPEAGWFTPAFDRFPYFAAGVPDPDPMHLTDTTGTWLSTIRVYNSTAVQACYANPEVNDLLCGSVPYFYPYIKSPILVSENTADEYQVHHAAMMPSTPSFLLNRTEKAYILYFAEQMRASLTSEIVKGSKAHQDGVFAPACFKHCFDWTETSGNLTWATVLGNWYFGRAGPTQVIDASQDITQYLTC